MQQPDQVDTEKTFLIESSFSAMRGMGKVALAEAASCIIAGLFEGGRGKCVGVTNRGGSRILLGWVANPPGGGANIQICHIFPKTA